MMIGVTLLELLTLIINFNYKRRRKPVADEINCRLIYRNEFWALRPINGITFYFYFSILIDFIAALIGGKGD